MPNAEHLELSHHPLLGVPVAQLTYDGLLRWMSGQVNRAGGAPTGRGAASVVFANVHVLTEAWLNAEYREAVLDATVVAPDGMPLVWGSALTGGTRLPDRCYGPDLMRAALDLSQSTGWRHYLYGAVDATLGRLRGQIEQRWPAATLAGWTEPPFGPLDDEVELSHIERINASGAQLVWVGMGCPKQEQWMRRYRRHLRAPLVLGVGAAFDFIAGVKPQAPRWMQGHGLEWLHRLGSDPSRLWRRYLVRNPLYVTLLAGQMVGGGSSLPGAETTAALVRRLLGGGS